MNAPFAPARSQIRHVDLADLNECARIETWLAAHTGSTPFHRPSWIKAIEQGTGNRAWALLSERGGEIEAYLPLNEVHSPIFGRLLASSGFAVDGGLLAQPGFDCVGMFSAVEQLAQRLSCQTIELRGGILPSQGKHWTLRSESHCGFVKALAEDDQQQLLAIPKRQRAEVRKGLDIGYEIGIGTAESDRAAHYAIYAESVRNLGTPVFPRSLFDAVLDQFGDQADIITVRLDGRPIASVLSVYHGGAVMPFWGGGIWEARRLRGNERIYYELMLHARRRGCTHFDFGRSKTDSGPYHFKRYWGFEPEPLTYAVWTMPGMVARNANPASAKHALQVALWKRLPLSLANRLGPWIARGLG